MKVLLLLIITFFASSFVHEKKKNKVEIYAVNFDNMYKYNLDENWIFSNVKPVLLGERESKCFIKKTRDEIEILRKNINQQPIKKSFDFRLVCIVNTDTLSYSYLNYMNFNGINIEPRSDDLLNTISTYVKDKKIKKSIKNNIRSNRRKE